jgi:hypothetical protein
LKKSVMVISSPSKNISVVLKQMLVYNKKQVISSFKSKEKAYEFH